MSRPVKFRCVELMPRVTGFVPVGGRADWGEVVLSVDEIEAIRLRDIEELEQEEGAQRMRVSRPTFQRILESARKKVAEALIEGKALRVEGGNYEMARRRFRCGNDGEEWDVPFEMMVSGRDIVCPRCRGVDVRAMIPRGLGLGRCGRRRGWRRRWQNQ